MRHKKWSRENGFTLVELLVVMAIISILSLITFGQFQTARRKANDVSRKGDLNSLTKALQMYYADYGSFPISSNGYLTVGTGTTVFWGGTFQDTASPPYVYMKIMPRENNSSMPRYCYVTSADGKSYGLFAMLENTADNQCSLTDGQGSYIHCGGNRYCYAVVSPNIKVSDLEGTLP